MVTQPFFWLLKKECRNYDYFLFANFSNLPIVLSSLHYEIYGL